MNQLAIHQLVYFNQRRSIMLFAYMRTSVWRKNKISMEMQLEAIREKAIELHLSPLQENQLFEDRGISGAKLEERKGLQELLAILQEPSSHNSTLMVYRFDRLSRDMGIMLKIMEVLENNEIRLISVMESSLNSDNIPMQKMLVHVHALVAQFERDMIIENVNLGLAQKRREGKPLSPNVPFGYRYSQDKLLPVETELKIVRYIYDLYLSGEIGYEKIVKQLTKKNYFFYDRPFIESDVYRILNNKTYYGVFKGGDVGGEYKGSHVTVVSEEEYVTVQKIRRRKQSAKVSTRKNWLRQKLTCPCCEQKLTPKMIRHNKTEYHYYYCANPQCKERVVSADAIEKEVKKAVIQFLVQSQVLEQMVVEIESRQGEELTQSRREQLQQGRKKERLLLQFEEGGIGPEEFSQAFSELRQVIRTTNRRPKVTVRRKDLQALLEQKNQIKKQTLPEEFYFDLVDRVNMDEKFRIKGIYCKPAFKRRI
jgi:site-specific DNA recombinase